MVGARRAAVPSPAQGILESLSSPCSRWNRDIRQRGRAPFGKSPLTQSVRIGRQRATYLRPQPCMNRRKDGARWPPGTADKDKVAVERNVPATMRDGTVLRADVYRPSEPGSYPVLLQRTPYDKGPNEANALVLASHGYLVVVQDIRGRYESEGEFAGVSRRLRTALTATIPSSGRPGFQAATGA